MQPTSENPITKFIELGKTLLIGIVTVIGLVAVSLLGLGMFAGQEGITQPDALNEAEFTTVQITNSAGTQLAFNLEVADTAAKWSRGLMFRTSLPENGGMIFIFPSSQPMSFWMKDTLISLDIIFVDDTLRITDIHSSAKPNQIEETYFSSAPIRYAIELPGGTATRLGIKVGDLLSLTER